MLRRSALFCIARELPAEKRHSARHLAASRLPRDLPAMNCPARQAAQAGPEVKAK